MSEDAQNPGNIFTFQDEKMPRYEPQYSTRISEQHVPLIIDNGGFQCRAGWASRSQPEIVFKNITAKQRSRKEKEAEVQVGNDITNFEVARLMMRSQFDRNLVTQYDVQEQILDYLFTNLGINTEGAVDHPIVMTEAVANPNYCRQQMSELLFECYHVPKLAYGVDSLFSLYNNHPNPSQANAMIVGCGYQTTHILPVLNGRLDTQNCRRINMGGAQLDAFMQRLLQLKYPGHAPTVTLPRAEELLREHTYMAVDYLTELKDWNLHDYYEDNVHKIQLPFANAPGNLISAQQQKEKREQQIRRLKEINVKKRMEKLAEEEEELIQLMQIQELLADEDEDEFSNALSEKGYENEEELRAVINKLTISIQRLKAKLQGKEPPPEEPEPKRAAVFDLLDIPDDQLTPDQLAKKKRQYILQKAREGRARAQALQREKREKEVEAEKLLEKKRLTDFPGWLAEVRHKRQRLLDVRTSKKQKKQDMAKRKTFAAQQRMKIISQLAKNTKKEDTFGQDDKDWDVYKEINRDQSDSDSEAEEEQLEELETMLKEHDPEFQRELDDNEGEFDIVEYYRLHVAVERIRELDDNEGEFDIVEYYRLHVAVERIRVAELLFQPSMIGLEQAGVAEAMDYVFSKYTSQLQEKIAQYVFLTGSCANFRQLQQRMERELLQMRPFQSTFNVHTAANPTLDAWLGARKWVTSPDSGAAWITRALYEEMGGDYLREHAASNTFLPTQLLAPK